MKASHYVTPRTLADASFASWADPIERPTQRTVRAGWWLAALILAAGVVALGAVL